MKQYVYKPSDVGLTAWPPGELRLDGIEKTDNPLEADLLVYPAALHNFGSDCHALERLPFLSGKTNRLVCFDCSDFDTIFTIRDAILIRCNVKPFMRAAHPNTIMWPWPVEDFLECIAPPADGFKFDVSFHGWLSTNARRESSEACRVDPRLRADIAQYPDFCGYIYYEPEGIRRRAAYRESLIRSRVSLCPESIPGVLPYRFLEALSAGRVPLLVGSGYELPFSDRIPYEHFIIQVPAEKADRAADVAFDFLRDRTDDEIVQMGLRARHYWQLYLNREDWPRRMAEEVLRVVS